MQALTGILAIGILLVFIACLASLMGCSSTNRGPYFQRSDRSVHVMEDRIYNPHERHAEGIDSHTN